jgi:hypothetical protein
MVIGKYSSAIYPFCLVPLESFCLVLKHIYISSDFGGCCYLIFVIYISYCVTISDNNSMKVILLFLCTEAMAFNKDGNELVRFFPFLFPPLS